MYVSWAMDLDPKGASHIKETMGDPSSHPTDTAETNTQDTNDAGELRD